MFKTAGFEWREPGCSMCLAMNNETVPPGQRSVSTSNRNFVGPPGAGRAHASGQSRHGRRGRARRAHRRRAHDLTRPGGSPARNEEHRDDGSVHRAGRRRRTAAAAEHQYRHHHPHRAPARLRGRRAAPLHVRVLALPPRRLGGPSLCPQQAAVPRGPHHDRRENFACGSSREAPCGHSRPSASAA